MNKWGQGKLNLVQVPCWQSSSWWVLLLCTVGTCSKLLFLHFRLLSEKQFDFFNVEDNGSDMAANEVFSKSRERSISAPDVYRCRIISGKGPLNEVWITAWFKELQWVAKFWQALLFFFFNFFPIQCIFYLFPPLLHFSVAWFCKMITYSCNIVWGKSWGNLIYSIEMNYEIVLFIMLNGGVPATFATHGMFIFKLLNKSVITN